MKLVGLSKICAHEVSSRICMSKHLPDAGPVYSELYQSSHDLAGCLECTVARIVNVSQS